MLKEFKKFISKGNVIDLAIGVIIGAAFSKIITSLVDNVLMPFFGLIIGGLNFSGLKIVIKDSIIYYGVFIQNVVDFLIVSFCIFIFIKALNKFTKNKKENKKPEDIILLTQIRDLLKKRTIKK